MKLETDRTLSSSTCVDPIVGSNPQKHSYEREDSLEGEAFGKIVKSCLIKKFSLV
jgi:hypothetical protein